MPKKPKPLTREGEPTQKTPTGLEIPVPKRQEFFKGLKRVTQDRARRPASERDRETR